MVVATANATAIVVLRVDEGGARIIFTAKNGDAIVPKGWSPDGSRVLVWTRSTKPGLAWLSVSNSQLHVLPTRAQPDNDVAVSIDGRFIAFQSRFASTTARLFVMTSDGSGEVATADGLDDLRIFGWMPDGQHLLFLRGAALWSLSVRSGNATGAPVMLQRNLGTGLHGVPTALPIGITRSGTLFYRSIRATSDIYIASLDPSSGSVSSQAIPLHLSRPGDNVLPRWSPDGQKILYHWVQWAPADNIVYSLETGREERVASHVPSASICWTQNGTSILAIPYVGGASPYQGLVQVNLRTGESVQLAAPSPTMIPLNCAGSLVTLATTDALRVFDFSRKSETTLYRYSVPTNTRPSLSHDATLVATVTQVAPGVTALLVVPTGGGQPRELVRLTEPAQFQQTFFGFTWSPDDRFVYYLKRPNSQGPFELHRVLSAGGPEQPMNLKFPALRDIDISPDGTRIAFSVGEPLFAEVWALENVMDAAPR